LRRLPAIRSNDEKVKQEAERQAINSPIQRFASDLGLMGMSIFAEFCPWEVMHPLGFIHDSTVLEAREDYAVEAMESIKWILQNLPLLDWFDLDPPIPILADVACGLSLGEMEEDKSIEAIRPLWLPANISSMVTPMQRALRV
jgi:DNA polymerase I-like protein with 3'-5' exonuclease and polymerase domains